MIQKSFNELVNIYDECIEQARKGLPFVHDVPFCDTYEATLILEEPIGLQKKFKIIFIKEVINGVAVGWKIKTKDKIKNFLKAIDINTITPQQTTMNQLYEKKI